MISLSLSLSLLALAFAGDIDLREIKSAGDGGQSITIVMTELDAEVRPRIYHLGQDLYVDAEPIAEDTRAGTIRAEPRRFVHLQIVDQASDPPAEIYAGLIALPDQDQEMLAFKYLTWQARGDKRQRLSRIPLVPYTRVEMAWGELPYIASGGVWAALVLLYAAAMAGLFFLRRRAGEQG